MRYDYLNGMIRQYETPQVKAYRGASYRVNNTIPDAFGLLVPDIIQILQKNINKLCSADEMVVILGLQPAGQMLESARAKKLRRSYDKQHKARHFCCTLDYQIVPTEQDYPQAEWLKTDSLVIDFTAGDIMNDRAYLSKLTLSDLSGVIYGMINPQALSMAWRIAKIKSTALV